jgi:hypothetical protein
MFKKLLLLFKLDNYKDLRKILGVKPSAFNEWRAKEKKGQPLAHNNIGLLGLILRQQEEIQALKIKLKDAERLGGNFG